VIDAPLQSVRKLRFAGRHEMPKWSEPGYRSGVGSRVYVIVPGAAEQIVLA
jgi:hypothetical protein